MKNKKSTILTILSIVLIIICSAFDNYPQYDFSHWEKKGANWYHYNQYGELDKDKWILWWKDNRIYRVGYDGKMCRGWVADPYSHIEYYMDETEDGGFLIMDNMDSTYTESYNRILEIIKLKEKNILEPPDIIFASN